MRDSNKCGECIPDGVKKYVENSIDTGIKAIDNKNLIPSNTMKQVYTEKCIV